MDVRQKRADGFQLYSFAPYTEGSKFRENINLLLQDIGSQKITMDEYVNISERQVKTMIANSTLIESRRITDGAYEYHRIVYTGDQNSKSLRFTQYYMIEGDKVYVLTLTCEKNSTTGNLETGIKILNTFRVKQ